MGVKSLHTSKILQLVQHIILSFHYLCTIILRNRKTIQYGYQSIEQICLARRNHPQGKEQGWHHPEGDSKQVVGL